MSLDNILSKTKGYLGVPSVVRYEQPFMSYLADDFNLSGYDVSMADRLVVVEKKGSKSSKIVTAHIDRHGIVTTDDGLFEFAAFNAKRFYGDDKAPTESLKQKSGERFIGEKVYAYDSLTGANLLEGEVTGYRSINDKLVFDINGLGKLPVGTPISYVSPILILNDGAVSSQIDNAISVAVANQLVRDGFDGTLLFTTEEEIGNSWRHIANYLASKDRLSQEIITLDTTPYEDTAALTSGLIVLRNRDQNGIFNTGLVQKLKSVCNQEAICFEMKDEVIEAENLNLPQGLKPKKLGSTELGRIVEHTAGALNGATVQLPTINYHTNHETTSMLAIKNYYHTLISLLS